jgi:hypothetical protein
MQAVGYCQSLNFIGAHMLLLMNKVWPWAITNPKIWHASIGN